MVSQTRSDRALADTRIATGLGSCGVRLSGKYGVCHGVPVASQRDAILLPPNLCTCADTPRILESPTFDTQRPGAMQVDKEVLQLLDEVLGLAGRSSSFDRDTRLLGALPELDSMAVVSIITALEDRFGLAIDDDDVDGSIFETVGSLVDFTRARVGA